MKEECGSPGASVCFRFWFLVLAVTVVWAGVALERAWAAGGRSYAILIVGDESDKEMLRREKVLIQEMAKVIKGLRAKGAIKGKLAIYSYHFNKVREKAYCERRLDILKEDLLFVGVVELQNRVPRRVVYRIDRINNPPRAAKDVVGRASELILPTVAVQPSPSPSPSSGSVDAKPDQKGGGADASRQGGNSEADRTDTRSTSGEEPDSGASSSLQSSGGDTVATSGRSGGGWCIQIGSFIEKKYAEDEAAKARENGYEARVVRVMRSEVVLYKVYVGHYNNREDAEAAIEDLKDKGFINPFIVSERSLPGIKPKNGDTGSSSDTPNSTGKAASDESENKGE